MRFEALELSIELIRTLRPLVETIRRNDAELARQIRRSASSVALNLAEGAGRSGKDRKYHWRIADGSARESKACLRIAEAWGYLSPDQLSPSERAFDRLLRLTWGLTR